MHHYIASCVLNQEKEYNSELLEVMWMERDVDTLEQPDEREKHAQIDPTAAARFLETLFSTAENGFLTFWRRDTRESGHFSLPTDLAALVERVLKPALKTDIYYAPGLRDHDLGRSKRGGSEHVIAIPGFWFDVDIAGLHHKEKRLPPDLERALGFLDSLEFRPSLTVSSGGGVQAYWLFRELWVFQDPLEKEKAARLSAGWQRSVREAARQHGWIFDNTSDLARMLRLPGSLNHKSAPPKAVVILEDTGLRYNPSDFQLHEARDYATEFYPIPAGVFPPASFEAILSRCAWLRHCRDDADRLSEPEWYAALGIAGRCRDGEKHAHAISAPYPQYNAEETAEKIRHALAAAGPRTCRYIRESFPGWCEDCRENVTSPILLGMPRQSKTGIFEPVVIKPTSAQNLLSQNPTHREDVVKDILPSGGSELLAGAAKTGKTILTIQKALAVARGEPFLGFPTKKGAVLFLSAEGGPQLLRERLAKMVGEDRRGLDALYLWWPEKRNLQLDLAEDRAAIIAACKELNISLLIIDPLIKFHALDENSAMDMASLTTFLAEIRQATGAAILLVHHTRKSSRDSKAGSAQEARGSSVLHGEVDAALILERRRASNDFVLHAELRWSAEPAPLLLKLDEKTLLFTVVDRLEGRERKVSPNEVFRALEKAGPVTVRDLSQLLRVSEKTARAYLAELEAAGRAKRDPGFGKGAPRLWRVVNEDEPSF